MRIVFTFLLYLTSHFGLSQNNYFEGAIKYSHKELDSEGKPRSTLVEEEKIFFSKNILLGKVISGPQRNILGDWQVYLNSEIGVRYKIDHDNRLIKNVEISPSEEIRPLEEKTLGEEKILEYSCDVHFLKYVLHFEGPSGMQEDTLTCTYYNSKKLKIYKPTQFALLQGNKNSLILDGRYDDVPLKIVIKRSDRSMIIVEAKEVKSMNVDQFVKLPDYPFEN